MTNERAAPEASATPEEHADWLELLAFQASDKNSSFQDLVKEIRHSGSTDALSDEATVEEFTDSRSERAHQVAEDAFIEISDRRRACGKTESMYTFEVGQQYIQARPGFEQSVYTFLLLLSTFGKDAGPKNANAVRLFNEISAHAGCEYFGGPQQGTRTYIFDFPRTKGPKNFRDALDDLCNDMAEGAGYKHHPTGKDQKDAKLDIAIWKPFDDGRVGKLIGFGQCATGAGWPNKLGELRPEEFADWMTDRPRVMPIRLFFTPFRADSRSWDKRSLEGGILFDRCRIAGLASGVDAGIKKKCERWSRSVIEHHLS